jgi:hypothetical protein
LRYAKKAIGADGQTCHFKSARRDSMNSLKQLEKHLKQGRLDSANPVFERLIKSLCFKEHFDLSELYELNYDDFELALNILKDWRLDRYTKTKERLKEMYNITAK